MKNRGEKVNDSGTGRTMHNAPEMRMAGNFKEIQSDWIFQGGISKRPDRKLNCK